MSSSHARPSMAARKSSMRPPTMRPPPSRAQTATPTLNGRTSPTESLAPLASTAKSPARSVNGGVKRKERDFEQDTAEETNINVVVRCRGRNDREVRENSGVVVSTDGVKGKKVDLSMGPSAMSNKTYHFDKVFSPAATQEMLFQEVVSPILDEVGLKSSGRTARGRWLTNLGSFRLQLYDLRLRSDRHGKDVHNVRRHLTYTASPRRSRNHPPSIVLAVRPDCR